MSRLEGLGNEVVSGRSQISTICFSSFIYGDAISVIRFPLPPCTAYVPGELDVQSHLRSMGFGHFESSSKAVKRQEPSQGYGRIGGRR